MMKQRLKAWIASKRRNGKGEGKTSPVEPEIPFFIDPQQAISTASSSHCQEQTSTIFDKLPPEIRRDILLKAFGGRRVHMDLVYQHPLKPPGSEETRRVYNHYGVHTERAIGLDESKPKCWQWRGCVCHRTYSPAAQKSNEKFFKLRQAIGDTSDDYSHYSSWQLGEERDRLLDNDELGEDTCCEGWASQCITRVYAGWGGTADSCWIGAVGWLLTCRQAYIEGVEVLYGINTIHISSKPLLTNLSRLISSQRLLDMNSLEIVWNLDTLYLPRGWPIRRPVTKGIRQDQLSEILEIVGESNRHIRRLHLAFVLKTPINDELYLDDTVFQLDRFAASLSKEGNLKVPLQVSITSTIYKKLYKKAKAEALNKELVQFPLEFQFWCYTSGQSALAPRTSDIATFGKVDGATVENGYWIVRGDKDDDRWAQHHVACFGSSAMM